jgi:hypothetical protein
MPSTGNLVLKKLSSYPAPLIVGMSVNPTTTLTDPTSPLTATPSPAKHSPLPIRVDKPKGRCKVKNVFINDRGFPDLSDEYNMLLHNIDGGTILRKLKHSPPDFDGPPDPSFLFQHNKVQHGSWMCKQLDISHLDKLLQDRIYALIMKYWSVFNKRGIFVPVRNYEWVIDTGNTPPIAVKKICYGPKEIPIMQKAIAVLQKVRHI